MLEAYTNAETATDTASGAPATKDTVPGTRVAFLTYGRVLPHMQLLDHDGGILIVQFIKLRPK